MMGGHLETLADNAPSGFGFTDEILHQVQALFQEHLTELVKGGLKIFERILTARGRLSCDD